MKPEYITPIDWQLLQEKYPNELDKVIEKLEKYYPVQYLIGNVEFLNTTILVDERALIPRFETELLVEKTINKIKELQLKEPKIIELGTGSGCISIALKKNLHCDMTAVDISTQALELAKENATLNHTEINFIEGDMLKQSYEHFDVLISNPPYVSEDEPVGKETKYEPQNALFAQNKGLYFYEEIIKKIATEPNQLKLIAFEIGMTQGTYLKELTQKYLPTYTCKIEKDLTGKDRFAFLSIK